MDRICRRPHQRLTIETNHTTTEKVYLSSPFFFFSCAGKGQNTMKTFLHVQNSHQVLLQLFRCSKKQKRSTCSSNSLQIKILIRVFHCNTEHRKKKSKDTMAAAAESRHDVTAEQKKYPRDGECERCQRRGGKTKPADAR